MRRRRLKHTLAVSTIVANMLMISITLALGAILVAWAGTSFGAFSSGSQIFFVQRGQALQERFVIEQVFFNRTETRVLVFVRNVGVEEIRVVAIYVNGNSLTPTGSGGTCIFDDTKSPPSLLLTVGAVCEFNLDWQSWNTGDIFNIVVASARGNQATFTARGP